MTQSSLPPAGWYEDPGGAGLRWWDGAQWTEHVQASEPASVSQPPPGAVPLGGESSSGEDTRRKRPRAVLLAVSVAVVVVAVAVVALTTFGDDSGAAYAECRQDVQPVVAAMQNLGSHLDVGVVQRDYAAEVGDVQATYDRLTRKHPALACQPVVSALGEAMDAYAQASSEWNECIVEAEECEESSTQELWSNADKAITSAKQRLNSLTGGASAVATAEAEAAQTQADALAKTQIHSAQVAIETYATDHDGSYEGATTAKLRAIEPSLPSSLEVTEAGDEYFSISVASKSGNWFEIEREFGGGLVFKCGEPGDAGCPGSGDWG